MNCLQDLCPKWFKGRRRLFMVALLNVVFFLMTIPFCTRGGIYVFQLLDWYAAAWTLLFVCFVECIVFTWIYGCERLNKDLILMIGRPLPAPIRITGAFVTPLFILVLLILSFVRYTPPTYGSYIYPASAEVIGWSLAFAIISPIFIMFIVKLARSRGTLLQRLGKIRQPSGLWGPNDQTTYNEDHDIWSHDKNDQTERTLLSTLKYNVTGRRHNSLRSDYVINRRDENTLPMMDTTNTYNSKH